MKIVNRKPISFCQKLNNKLKKEQSKVNFNALNKAVFEVSMLTLYPKPINTRSKPVELHYVKDQDNMIGLSSWCHVV